MSTLEERIREFMVATGWDVPKIASIACVSQSAVWQWLGKGSKIIKTIGSLEAALLLERESGFSALWLAKGKGPKFARRGESAHGEVVRLVKPVTPLPAPFDEDRFDALSREQQSDVAHVAAYLVDAFARHNAPPTSGGRAAWKQRPPIEAESAVGPRSRRSTPNKATKARK